MKTELKKRSLQNLADSRLANELRPKPEFQRGTVWELPQKQELIDSLLRDWPFAATATPLGPLLPASDREPHGGRP